MINEPGNTILRKLHRLEKSVVPNAKSQHSMPNLL